jgi:hypothetical protein
MPADIFPGDINGWINSGYMITIQWPGNVELDFSHYIIHLTREYISRFKPLTMAVMAVNSPQLK